ncbi:hypothetical protein [Noviherbaspirillum humi]|nr:hypothetical protein [Noviherbaspirillum humi]
MKLDEATWQAIDWLADQQSKTWQVWCADALAPASDAENMTAALREAAMCRLLEQTIFQDRAAQYAAMGNHPLIRDSGMLDDAELGSILEKAHVQGRLDFGGFEVVFGFDEHGQDCVWIRNGLRNGLHFAFIVPHGLTTSNEKHQ